MGEAPRLDGDGHVDAVGGVIGDNVAVDDACLGIALLTPGLYRHLFGPHDDRGPGDLAADKAHLLGQIDLICGIVCRRGAVDDADCSKTEDRAGIDA
jgi:hypothetical protein